MKNWLAALLLLAACAPARAQFPIIPIGPEKPTAPPAPPSEANVKQWLQNLQTAKTDAENAAQKGDLKKRDAAIQDAAKWAEAVADPHGVSNANQLKAFEIIGGLAREMAAWNTDFGTTKLSMVDVRIKPIIEVTKGADKARLLVYQGDVQAAQDYGSFAFDAFATTVDVKEADPAVVKYAIERGYHLVQSYDRPRLKPFFSRMLELQLTPAERADWQLKQHLYTVETEYQGEARDAALVALKAVVYDPKADLKQRDLVADTYVDTVFGPERVTFFNDMVAAMAKSSALQSKWLFERGKYHTGEKEWQEAVADYKEAARVAPVGAQKDAALLAATQMSVERLNVRAEALPALEALSKSPHLSQPERFNAALTAGQIAYGTKDVAGATARTLEAKALAGDDVWLQAKAGSQLTVCYLAAGKLEDASQTWQGIPFDKLSYSGFDVVKSGIKNQVAQTGVQIYQRAIAAKKLPLAQGIYDTVIAKDLLTYGDRKLLEVNWATTQGQYDKALTLLQELSAQATTENDKLLLAKMIAAVQQQKAAANAPAAPN